MAKYVRGFDGIHVKTEADKIFYRESDDIKDLLDSEIDLFLVKVFWAVRGVPKYPTVQHFAKGTLGYQNFIDSLERLYDYAKEHGENPTKYRYEIYLLKESKAENKSPIFTSVAMTTVRNKKEAKWKLI